MSGPRFAFAAAAFGLAPELPALLLAVLAAATACTQFKQAAGSPAPEAGADALSTGDAGSDAAAADAASPDAGPPDAASPDAGSPDAASPDAASPDAGSPDAGPPDVASPDAGPGDSASGDDGPASDCDGSLCGIETIVSGLIQAGTIAVDGTNVYVDDQGSTTGTVYQCDKTGCAMPTVLGPGYATGIVSDAHNVYWNDFSGGKIVRCAIGGCANAPPVVAPIESQAEGLSFDGTNLYWASAGRIRTCPAPACGSPSILASGQSGVVVTSAETAVVYWVSSGSLLGCGAGGCGQNPTTILSSTANGDVFVKDGSAYFTSGNAIVSCPVTSTCAVPHTIGSSNAPFGIASDGNDVYWLDEFLAQVYRCPVTGCVGSAEVFADQTSFDPAGEIGTNVALDGEFVYWADPVSVYRKHK
jgi:hypothetical protein